jgi:hypothetical protein
MFNNKINYGGSIQSDMIRNIIYSKYFKPEKVHQPSQFIQDMYKPKKVIKLQPIPNIDVLEKEIKQMKKIKKAIPKAQPLKYESPDLNDQNSINKLGEEIWNNIYKIYNNNYYNIVDLFFYRIGKKFNIKLKQAKQTPQFIKAFEYIFKDLDDVINNALKMIDINKEDYNHSSIPYEYSSFILNKYNIKPNYSDRRAICRFFPKIVVKLMNYLGDDFKIAIIANRTRNEILKLSFDQEVNFNRRFAELKNINYNKAKYLNDKFNLFNFSNQYNDYF